MFVNIEFANGSNPYIATEDWKLFQIAKRCDLSAIRGSVSSFEAIERTRKAAGYAEIKQAVRDLAVAWSDGFGCWYLSWGELADWGAFFEKYGRRYGLLSEFRENAIC